MMVSTIPGGRAWPCIGSERERIMLETLSSILACTQFIVVSSHVTEEISRCYYTEVYSAQGGTAKSIINAWIAVVFTGTTLAPAHTRGYRYECHFGAIFLLPVSFCGSVSTLSVFEILFEERTGCTPSYVSVVVLKPVQRSMTVMGDALVVLLAAQAGIALLNATTRAAHSMHPLGPDRCAVSEWIRAYNEHTYSWGES